MMARWVCLFVCCWLVPGSVYAKKRELVVKSQGSFAVLELFTSQGCSSCPPADHLLSKIVRRYKGKSVFALSFHVDYWDHLGWRDPFGRRAFTAYQQRYAAIRRSRQVYTPQMIVNGRDPFVGSNRKLALSRLKRALRSAPRGRLSLRLRMHKRRLFKGSIIFQGKTKRTLLRVALVERQLRRKVLRGENAGRTLRHDNVVRLFRTYQSTHKTFLMRIPKTIQPKHTSLIVYVQRRRDLRVLAGLEVPLQKLRP
ncbi:MAG TPA: DUF1223 domain-containing protein [Myxococcales bacterium]|nr:DUF1223 domain-containing protein [Deltaproteobacteria bacterium]MBU54460.1 DUF1223 domain-containing protein [Deltaproteobacteria bacterium]HAA53195.1 DUF1223 domain-containing protein [Myxococcales bacterium]